MCLGQRLESAENVAQTGMDECPSHACNVCPFVGMIRRLVTKDASLLASLFVRLVVRRCVALSGHLSSCSPVCLSSCLIVHLSPSLSAYPFVLAFVLVLVPLPVVSVPTGVRMVACVRLCMALLYACVHLSSCLRV